MTKVTFNAGEIGLFPRHMERWIRAADQGRLVLNISREALMAASDGMNGEVELQPSAGWWTPEWAPWLPKLMLKG
jgi:hypothetical protein